MLDSSPYHGSHVRLFHWHCESKWKSDFCYKSKTRGVEHVNLWGSGNASETLSVDSGQIDFFIKDPDGGFFRCKVLSSCVIQLIVGASCWGIH